MEASPAGSLALVSYIPDPLGSFLDELRRSLPGGGFAQAHITILPPRSLHIAPELACELAVSVLREYSPVEIELGFVHCFDSTGMLYLPLQKGHSFLTKLHRELNAGGLAAEEEFEFVPHVTIGGPAPAADLGAVSAAAERHWQSCPCPKRFLLQEIVALLATSTRGDEDYGDWSCRWRYSLTSSQVHSMSATL